MRAKLVVVSLAVGAMLLAGTCAQAGGDPAAKCKEAKAKAAGQQAAALLKAMGKNFSKNPDPKLAANIAKAESKFTKAFSKAESKGGCLTNGDAGSLAAKFGLFIAETVCVANANCGDGTKSATCKEECDDGNTAVGDGCDGKCRTEDVVQQQTVSGGETVTTDTLGDDGPGATPTDPVETAVTPPDNATITIVETSTTVVPPSGIVLLDKQVEITVETQPVLPSNPLRILFELDSSLAGILVNIELELVHVFRDGVLVDPCASGPSIAEPDPCVLSRTRDGVTGDLNITVLTTAASSWSFGFPAAGFVDNGDGTITDNQTGLMWEKKDQAGGLHDVDNRYTWAGLCSVGGAYCQPNAAAAAACSVQTGGTVGCSECSSGTCDVDPVLDGAITTIWDWLVQVNAEGGSGFADHSDWRIPSEDGCNACWTGSPSDSCPCDPAELESILLEPYPCGTNRCIDGIFGPTAFWYWSSAPYVSHPIDAWFVVFADGNVGTGVKSDGRFYVRAVRGGP